jgi:hypothetical protein
MVDKCFQFKPHSNRFSEIRIIHQHHLSLLIVWLEADEDEALLDEQICSLYLMVTPHVSLMREAWLAAEML